EIEMTMNLDGRNVLVVGLARTGEATAAFLLRRGARVTVTESKSRAELGSKAETWVRRGVTLEAGGHTPAAFLEADLIIPSPGVPRLPEIAAARDRGIPVWSEIELASRFLKGSIVGLTGTNGKSTTTTLLHRILKDAGRPAFLAGNIGTPLISFVDRSRDDHLYVTEISSFQLEYIHAFRARLALVLNLSGNHLDWHGTMDDYAAAKAKLVLGQKAGDAAVLNREDARVWAWKEAAVSDVFAFSGKRPVRRGAFVRDGWVVVRDGGDERRILPVSEIKLPGLHNRENVLAAAAAARILGVAPSRIRASVRGFRGLEHRLEPVATVRGVSFINDSKATTVDATLKALAGFTRPVVLILGGKDKGSDFRPLRKAVRRGVKAVVLVGSAREKIREALAGTVPLLEAETYPEVVRAARAAAAPGDIVLLAPACTSWDMFRDFEERGRVFKREVRRLARRKG
ncbi:MAG TPA: UDP-N-acetylmuramoyl-L-alanine--D-glutamate ligase, partial [Candidatus Aminicenantes bacterium]|nr:UDP-N-acetylmuramoyl-L-alanine--D-glutamate ligase [Candidatus Aminicenantes bacterium]